MFRVLFCMFLCMLTLGCGQGASPVDQPVSVEGKVESQGKPVGGVTLILQPLDAGYVQNVDVSADGTFKVNTQAGKYAYYFSPAKSAKSVPPAAQKYVEASMERTVVVASGQPIVINLQ